MYSVTDLQACEPAALTKAEGVTVALSRELDSMGFHRADVFAQTREALLAYVVENWGDDSTTGGWYSEWVLARVEEIGGDAILYRTEDGIYHVPEESPRSVMDSLCPACGHWDVSGWADDGEADLADYWECQSHTGGCGRTGEIVFVADPTKTQNGLPIKPICPQCGEPSLLLISDVDSDVAYFCETHGAL